MNHLERMFAISLLTLGACATPLTVPDVPEVMKDLTPVLPKSGYKGISIICHTGTVRVDTGDEVALAGKFRARGDSEKEARARCDGGDLVVGTSEDGFLEIRCLVPPSCPLVNIDFSVVLTAPADMPIRIQIDGGHVAVRARSGPLEVKSKSASVSARLAGGTARIESTTGDVTVHGSAKELDLVTGSGAVIASFGKDDPLPGQLAFHSKAGSLTLELPFDAGLTFEHVTKSGKLISEFPIEWKDRSDGLFSGTIGTRPWAKLTAVTDDGDVELKISVPPAGL